MIDKLDTKNLEKGWSTIQMVRGLSLRHNLGVVPLNSHEIMIIGGKDDEVWGDLDDLLLFNTDSQTITKLKDKSHWPFTSTVHPCVKVQRNTVLGIDS